MDKDRIHRAALGRRAAATDVGRAARRRLGIYSLSALLIAGWYVFNRPDAEPDGRAQEPLAPLDLPDDERTPRAQVDRSLLQGVRDATRTDRAQVESDARLHLLEQAGRLVHGDLDTLGLDAGDWEQLLADPAAHRGDPVWALGRLQWTDSETFDRLPVVHGELLDEQGRPWTFLVLSEPFDIVPGDVVYVSGFFLKVQDALRPDGQLVTAPLIVGEELLRSSFRIEPVTELPPGLLDDVRDHDIAQASAPLDSPEFYTALSYVHHAPEERLFPPGTALPEVLPIEMLRDPSAWRGQGLLTTGVLLYMRQAPLGPRGQNPLGIPLHWQLWVSDTRSGSAGTMLIVCLERPDVSEKDIVDVRGLFFRRLAFENRRKEAKLAAVVLARHVTRYVPPPDTQTKSIVLAIAALVGVALLLLSFGQWRENRGAMVERGRRLKRKRRQVERGAVDAGADGTTAARASAPAHDSSPA